MSGVVARNRPATASSISFQHLSVARGEPGKEGGRSGRLAVRFTGIEGLWQGMYLQIVRMQLRCFIQGMCRSVGSVRGMA